MKSKYVVQVGPPRMDEAAQVARAERHLREIREMRAAIKRRRAVAIFVALMVLSFWLVGVSTTPLLWFTAGMACFLASLVYGFVYRGE